jgi:hypothetical protein
MVEVWGMGCRKHFSAILVFFFFLILTVIPTGPAAAQGGLPVSGLGASLQQGLTSLGGLNWQNVRIDPYVGVGYQKMGLNFSIPAEWFNGGVIPPIKDATLDLSLQDSNVWMGGVLMDVRLPASVTGFLRAEGSASRNSRIQATDALGYQATYPLGGQNASAVPPITWTAKVEWWSIDGGIGYRIRNDCAFVGGLMWDHLSLSLDDPRDSVGNPLNTSGPAGITIYTPHARSDLQRKLFIPYLGLKIIGPNYRGTLNYSPLAWVTVKFPETFHRTTYFAQGFVTSSDFSWNYRLANLGGFLEGRFEYEQRITDTALLQIWVRGRWLNVRGGSDMDVTSARSPQAPPVVGVSSLSTGTYSEYWLAGGLGAVLNF